MDTHRRGALCTLPCPPFLCVCSTAVSSVSGRARYSRRVLIYFQISFHTAAGAP